MFTYRATLTRVVDGDTIWVSVDLGFYLHQDMCLRLDGINTPETKGEERPRGLQVKQLVEDRMQAAKAIVLVTRKLGKFGRYVAKVYYTDKDHVTDAQVIESGICLNDQLLGEGNAIKVEYD